MPFTNHHLSAAIPAPEPRRTDSSFDTLYGGFSPPLRQLCDDIIAKLRSRLGIGCEPRPELIDIQVAGGPASGKRALLMALERWLVENCPSHLADEIRPLRLDAATMHSALHLRVADINHLPADVLRALRCRLKSAAFIALENVEMLDRRSFAAVISRIEDCAADPVTGHLPRYGSVSFPALIILTGSASLPVEYPS